MLTIVFLLNVNRILTEEIENLTSQGVGLSGPVMFSSTEESELQRGRRI
jgi:hypothetical protein